MIKVLGICGSPRIGNSQFLLDKAMEAVARVSEEVQIKAYTIRGKQYAGCVMCQTCMKDGECVIKDDFQELRDLWIEADVIIYSVPVYHMGMPAQLKAFIDRLGNSLFGRYKDNFPVGSETLPRSLKVIGSIAQGTHVFSGQEHTLTDLINHALIMGCVPVTGDMWESYIGVGGWTSTRTERNAMEELVAAEDYDAMVAVRASRSIGKRAVEMSMLLQAGARASQDYFSKDPVYAPFLERTEQRQAE
jgi:multimeric flavodoxin WrbA